MLRNIPLALSLICVLVFASPLYAATDATVQQVYEAAQAGHLQQAQQMMNQVLQDHPRSGRAHYVAAELYAKARNPSMARAELATAQKLAPGLPFATPAAVRALQEELSQERPARVLRTDSAAPWSPPWATVVLVLVGVGVIWFIARRRQAANAYPQYSGGMPAATATPMNPGGAGVAGTAGSGIGSGIAGGLASGVAVGAGVVAGEELARHFLGGGGEANAAPVAPPVEPPANGDMGGNDFGLSGTNSWDDDDQGAGQDSNDDGWT